MGEETDRVTELAIHPATAITEQWIATSKDPVAPEDAAAAFKTIYKGVVAALKG